MTTRSNPVGAWRAVGMAAAMAFAGLGMATSTQAAPIYLIDATTDGLAPDASFSNVAFSLTYEDVNLDQLFSLDELLAFTGVYDTNGNYFDQLTGIPTLTGVTGNGTTWDFNFSGSPPGTYSAPAGSFTPFTSVAGDVIPEPGTIALVTLALLGLLPLRRQPRKLVPV